MFITIFILRLIRELTGIAANLGALMMFWRRIGGTLRPRAKDDAAHQSERVRVVN
jgi:hypothetical protein